MGEARRKAEKLDPYVLQWRGAPGIEQTARRVRASAVQKTKPPKDTLDE